MVLFYTDVSGAYCVKTELSVRLFEYNIYLRSNSVVIFILVSILDANVVYCCLYLVALMMNRIEIFYKIANLQITPQFYTRIFRSTYNQWILCIL